MPADIMSRTHTMHTHIWASMRLARELKRGSAELLILALLEEQERHGYDLARLIGTVARRRSAFTSPRSIRRSTAWKTGPDRGPLGRKGRSAAARYYRLTRLAGRCWRASGRSGNFFDGR